MSILNSEYTTAHVLSHRACANGSLDWALFVCLVISFNRTICPHVLALASHGTVNLLRTAMEEGKASYGMDENDRT